MDTSVIESDLISQIESDINSKAWKTRVVGYQKIVSGLLAAAPSFGLYLPLLRKVAEESSTLAQDSCLGALSTFFENVNEDFMLAERAKWESIVPEICTALILSTMGTGEKTHERGEAVLLKICETGGCKVPVEALIAGVSNRRLKIPPACLKSLRTVLQKFGSRAVPTAIILNALFDAHSLNVLNSSKEPTRRAAMALFVELRRWGVNTASVDDTLSSDQLAALDTLLAAEQGEDAAPPVPSMTPKKWEKLLAGAPAVAAGTGQSVEDSILADITGAKASDAATTKSAPPVESVDSQVEEPVEEEVNEADVTLQLQPPIQGVVTEVAVPSVGKVESTRSGTVKDFEDGRVESSMNRGYEFDVDAKVGACGVKEAREGGGLGEMAVCLSSIAAILEAESQAAGKDNKLHLSKCLLTYVVAMCVSVLRETNASDKDLRSALRAINSCAARLVPSRISPEFTAETLDSIISSYKEQKVTTDTSFALLSIYQNLPTLEADLMEAVGVVFKTTSSSPRSSSLPPHSRSGLIEFVSEAVAIAAGQVPGAIRDTPLLASSLHTIADISINALRDMSLREQSIYILSTLHSMVTGKSAAYAGEEAGGTAVIAMIDSVKHVEDEGTFARLTNQPRQAKSPRKPAAKKTKVARKEAPPTTICGGGSGAVVDLPVPPQVRDSAQTAMPPKVPVDVASGSETVASSNNDIVSDVGSHDDSAVAQEALASLNIPNWGSGFDEDMAGAKWQSKVACIELLGDAVAAGITSGNNQVAPMVAYLYAKTDKFKATSNVNTCKALIAALQKACAACPCGSVSTSTAMKIVTGLGDKVGDKKVNKMMNALLIALLSACTGATAGNPTAIYAALCDKCDAAKTPVLKQGYLEAYKAVVESNPMGLLPLLPLGRMLQSCCAELDHKLPLVRNAALEAIGAVYRHVGLSQLVPLMSGEAMNKHKRNLDEIFAKVGSSGEVVNLAPMGDSSSRSGKGGPSPSSGRKSLPKDIHKNLIATEGKNAWKERKAALESLLKVCENSYYLIDHNKIVDETFRALKQKGMCLADTQANNKPFAATATAALITSLDVDPAAKCLRTIIGAPLMLGLTDNKSNMRNATFAALSKVVHRSMSYEHNNDSATGTPDLCVPLVVAMLPTAADVLSTSAAARAQLLTLLEDWVKALPVYANKDDAPSGITANTAAAFSEGCDELSGPLLASMQDKVSTVRDHAKRLLISLAQRGSVRKYSIEHVVRDLTPAAKRTLGAALQEVYHTYTTNTPVGTGAPPANAGAAKGSSPVKKGTVSPKKNAPSASSSNPTVGAQASSDGTKPALEKPRRVLISPTKKAKEASLGAPQREVKAKPGSPNRKPRTKPSIPAANNTAVPAAAATNSKGSEKACVKVEVTVNDAIDEHTIDGEEEKEPFKLRMSLSPSSSATVSEGNADAAAVASNGAMYTVVAEKLEEFVSVVKKAAHTTKQSSGGVNTLSREKDEANDYVKLLHGILRKASSDGGSDESTREAELACLWPHVDALLYQLTQVLCCAFDLSPVAMVGKTAELPIDTSLASSCLAATFTLLQFVGSERADPGIVRARCNDSLSPVTVSALLEACLHLMTDSRLSTSTSSDSGTGTSSDDEQEDADSPRIEAHIVRALNIIALKLTSLLPPCTSLTAIMTLLNRQVVGNEDLVSWRRKAANGNVATVLVARPTSKLLLKVLTSELKRDTPFLEAEVTSPVGSDDVEGEPGAAASRRRAAKARMLKKDSSVSVLLSSLVTLLASLQQHSTHTENSLLFMCAKTLLCELVNHVGATRLLNILSFIGLKQADNGAPFIISMIKRIDAASESLASGNSAGSLSEEVSAIPVIPLMQPLSDSRVPASHALCTEENDENKESASNGVGASAGTGGSTSSDLSQLKASLAGLTVTGDARDTAAAAVAVPQHKVASPLTATFPQPQPGPASSSTMALQERIANIRRKLEAKDAK